MEPQPRQVTPTQRLTHRCGRFLGKLRNGTFYLPCPRCKTLSPFVLDSPRTKGGPPPAPYRSPTATCNSTHGAKARRPGFH